MRKVLILVTTLTYSMFSLSGTWTPDQPTVINLASTYSWEAKCSERGYANSIKTVEFGNRLQAAMTPASWQVFNKMYQNSLHENAIYSIANKMWMPYKITQEDCKTADSVVNIYLQRMGG